MSTDLNVSRETLERLRAYESLLRKWNPKINLVARSTLDDLWARHIVDSAQVFDLNETLTGTWFDIGSGGGFPGLVCAVIAAEKAPDLQFHLVDSDQRKCAFLRNAAREMGVTVKVTADRIENIAPAEATIISARALASLSDLLNLAHRHMGQGATLLFQKGRNWQEELRQAQTEWRFQHDVQRSTTSDEAVILRIKEVEHV